MTAHRVLQPPGWAAPRGYANGVVAQGRTVFVAGQIGWDAGGTIVSDDLVAQVRQALLNVCAVLAEAGATPAHIVRMTWYVTDRAAWLARGPEIGAVYRALIGSYAVAMSAVQVVALMEARALVEVEVTAVLPEVEVTASLPEVEVTASLPEVEVTASLPEVEVTASLP